MVRWEGGREGVCQYWSVLVGIIGRSERPSPAQPGPACVGPMMSGQGAVNVCYHSKHLAAISCPSCPCVCAPATHHLSCWYCKQENQHNNTNKEAIITTLPSHSLVTAIRSHSQPAEWGDQEMSIICDDFYSMY